MGILGVHNFVHNMTRLLTVRKEYFVEVLFQENICCCVARAAHLAVIIRDDDIFLATPALLWFQSWFYFKLSVLAVLPLGRYLTVLILSWCFLSSLDRHAIAIKVIGCLTYRINSLLRKIAIESKSSESSPLIGLRWTLVF